MKGTTYKAAKPMVFTASLLLLLGGCTQDAKLAPGESPAVAAVTKELGGSRFLKAHSQRNAQGYTIESGKLTDSLKGTVVGALVMVTDKDGAITAFIDRDGQRGILRLDAKGKKMFSPDAELAFPDHDSIETTEAATVGDTHNTSNVVTSNAVTYIDALVGFTAKALAAREVDPIAFALGQMEWVNLSLRNSRVNNIELRLAGVRVTDQDIPVTGGGLSTWQTQLRAQRANYLSDINVGFSVGGDASGWAYRPGYSSVNSILGTSPFKHELGHNVGGAHCYPNAGDNYRHGFNAGGGFTTNLCGNGRPYYSTPDVTVDGKVIGNAEKADMARLWREQAGRLSRYSPAFEGKRMIYTSYQQDASLSFQFNSQRSMGGVVALSSEVGPTSLTYGGPGGTTLKVKLQGGDGNERLVNFRAVLQIEGCPESTTMNSYVVCHPDFLGAEKRLTLSYHAEDNPELPQGWYSGAVQLKALATDDPDWSLPILVSLAVKR
ncbi:hypothetical protein KSS93_04890 [Pseudomonas xanthosomatis]|uniref:hypothetical protein n=1 Tax=Pseudomonas xanthosomatis TaxID=2842356 RepID=UPI001C3E03AF|nr:hypothetical protein [Pseudomonas xanthosomatis]QXH47266.1 hypothetical protein KSS93_04890 [Pseudomonas xanthosomatis]